MQDANCFGRFSLIYLAFTSPPTRAPKWPEVKWTEASSGESGAPRLGRRERREELKSGQLYDNEL